MKKDINDDRKFLIQRLGYFRNQANMSARELSGRLGCSEGYIGKYELGLINMPSEVLLDVMKILNVSPEKFFSKNPEKFDEHKDLIDSFERLSEENKKLAKAIIKALS